MIAKGGTHGTIAKGGTHDNNGAMVNVAPMGLPNPNCAGM